MIKKYKFIILFLISTIFLALAWNHSHTEFLIFFAFVPIFYILNLPQPDYNTRLSIYILTPLFNFSWVYYTLYWIGFLNAPAHFTITILNTIAFSLSAGFAYYSRFKRNAHPIVSSFIYISALLIIESLNDQNILGFPYINLGQILGSYPILIHWYEITGAIGGSIWILLVNMIIAGILFQVIHSISTKRHSIKLLKYGSAIILLPIILSIFILKTKNKAEISDIKAFVAHTDANVVDYKYEVEPLLLLEDYISLTEPYLDSTSKGLVIWPENALTNKIDYFKTDTSSGVIAIKERLCNKYSCSVITGSLVEETVPEPGPKEYAPGVIYNEARDVFFRRYNTALHIRSNEKTEIKIKKRLVPFSEKKPKKKIYAPLVHLFPNMAGLNFSSKDDEQIAFYDFRGKLVSNPIICYSSAFAPYVANETLKSKANYLTVISNEGWMKKENAYKQFTRFCRCRAIENRRFLMKSSNQGQSAIINQDGKILKEAIGKNPVILTANLELNSHLTFYSKHSNLISWIIFGISTFLFLALQTGIRKKR